MILRSLSKGASRTTKSPGNVSSRVEQPASGAVSPKPFLWIRTTVPLRLWLGTDVRSGCVPRLATRKASFYVSLPVTVPVTKEELHACSIRGQDTIPGTSYIRTTRVMARFVPASTLSVEVSIWSPCPCWMSCLVPDVGSVKRRKPLLPVIASLRVHIRLRTTPLRLEIVLVVTQVASKVSPFLSTPQVLWRGFAQRRLYLIVVYYHSMGNLINCLLQI